MSETKVKGIVLKASDRKEKDKLVHIFTLEKGLIVANIKGVKNANAKLKILAQPFCVADFILNEKNGFYTVINGDVIETFFDLSKDYDKYVTACCFTEAVRSALLSLKNDEKYVFVLLLKALRELTYGSATIKFIYVKFFYDLIKVCGYKLNISNCSVCGDRFTSEIYCNNDDLSFVCENCKMYNCENADKAALKFIDIVQDCEYEHLKDLKVNEQSIKYACNFITNYIKTKLMINMIKIN